MAPSRAKYREKGWAASTTERGDRQTHFGTFNYQVVIKSAASAASPTAWELHGSARTTASASGRRLRGADTRKTSDKLKLCLEGRGSRLSQAEFMSHGIVECPHVSLKCEGPWYREPLLP